MVNDTDKRADELEKMDDDINRETEEILKELISSGVEEYTNDRVESIKRGIKQLLLISNSSELGVRVNNYEGKKSLPKDKLVKVIMKSVRDIYGEKFKEDDTLGDPRDLEQVFTKLETIMGMVLGVDRK